VSEGVYDVADKNELNAAFVTGVMSTNRFEMFKRMAACDVEANDSHGNWTSFPATVRPSISVPLIENRQSEAPATWTVPGGAVEAGAEAIGVIVCCK
jgi:hypothetical protein